MFSSRQIRNLWLFQFAADLAAIVAAYATTYAVRFYSGWGARFFTAVNQFLGVRRTGELGDLFEDFYLVSAPRIIVILALTLGVLYALRDLYPGRRFIRKRPTAWNIIVANLFAIGIFYAYWYLRRNVFHPRSFFVTLMALNVFFCVTFRAAMSAWLGVARTKLGIDVSRAIVIGRNREADLICGLIEEFKPHGLTVEERIDWEAGEPFDRLVERVETSARERPVDMIVAADKRLSVAQVMRLLEVAELLDVEAKVLSDKMDVLLTQARLPLDRIYGIPLVHFNAPSSGLNGGRGRRLLAWVLALIALVVTAPLVGLIALLVRLTSQGSALFIQERIGVNRRPFRMLKFRTMYHRSDELQAQVEEFNESAGGLFKIMHDPRVTPVGRFLRRFSLDELPQLVNVLRGEMTLVGPRPLPRRDFENYYEDWHYSRHSGMPGLTCLWQVSGRSDIDFHNMCILDVYYLRNQSWVLDLRILLRTVWVVLFARGAY